MAAIEKRYIEDVLKPLGFTGSFEEFVRKVQVDQRFFVESAERLKGLYEEKCKEVKRVIPRFFSRSPKSPLINRAQDSGSSSLLPGWDGRRFASWKVLCEHTKCE